MTEKSGQNQTGRFQKGMSGNPSGKPKGARARVTLLAEKLLEDDRDAIVRAVIATACAIVINLVDFIHAKCLHQNHMEECDGDVYSKEREFPRIQHRACWEAS
jgi:Family of unknown function (DUF5681)